MKNKHMKINIISFLENVKQNHSQLLLHSY